LFEWIKQGVGYILGWIYELVPNYGVALILFTFAIKLLLLPLGLKQQKSMTKMQVIQPKVEELKEKYKDDKQKLQQETAKLYKEYNVGCAGGCLPMLIQLPILIMLYRVIQEPLEYMLHMSGNEIKALATEFVIKSAKDQIAIAKAAGKINFDFLGLDLSQKPSAAISPIMNGDFSNLSIVLLILIPVLAVLTTWLSSKYMQGQNKSANSAANEQAQQMTSSMNIIMPIMTGYFTFILPSGMGLYWIISSVMQFVQQVALNYYFDKKGDDFDVKLPEKNNKKRKKH